MSRLTIISALGLASIATLNAGQIQIGGADGLTKSYVSTIAGAPTLERRWRDTLFSNVVPVAGGANDIPSWADTTPGPAAQLQDANGINFARNSDTDDGTGTKSGAWVTSNTLSSASSFTIPVGVSGVTKVYTMLNDYWGATGLVNTYVTFNWQTAGSETVALTNGQQIRSAIDYTSGTATVQNGSGQAIANGLTSGAVSLTTTLGQSVNVTASQLASFAYSSTPTSPYTTTAGNVVLDEQLFDFGSLRTGDYLVSITIRNQLASGQAGSGSASTNGNLVTRAALSAITVDAVPEPSTIVMALSGLGLVAFARRRRKA